MCGHVDCLKYFSIANISAIKDCGYMGFHTVGGLSEDFPARGRVGSKDGQICSLHRYF